MKKSFATTSNVQRFLSAVAALKGRGAPEATWLLVTSHAALGKTEMVQWWAAETGSVYLRAKAEWTPRWALAELVRELGQTPERTKQDLFSQAFKQLARSQTPVVIDEVENAMHHMTVLETFRDLSDLTECPIIVVGMDQVRTRLLRHEQISSRITQVVEFEPASADDVRTLAAAHLDIGLDGTAVDRILADSEGRYRLLMDALAEVERRARRLGKDAITAKDLGDRPLTHDWRVGARRDISRRAGGR